MQISPVSCNMSRNGNVNFNGTVDKKVIKAVKKLEMLDAKELLLNCNYERKLVSLESLNALKTKTGELINKLKTFAEQLPNEATLYIEKSRSGSKELYVKYCKGSLNTELNPSASGIYVDGRAVVPGISQQEMLEKSLLSLASPQEVSNGIFHKLLRDIDIQIQVLKIKTPKALEKRYNELKKAFPNEQIPEIESYQKKLQDAMEHDEIIRKNRQAYKDFFDEDDLTIEIDRIIRNIKEDIFGIK